jgi:20S proteasome alpha/beta subunit
MPYKYKDSFYHYLCCVLYLAVVPDIGHGITSPPWTSGVQQSSQDSWKYLDLPATVFAPHGRLHSVESATRACDAEYSNTVIAVVCGEGVIVVSSMQTSPYLFDVCSEDGLQYRPVLKEHSSNSLLDNELSILRPPFSGIVFPGAPCNNDELIIGITGGNPVDAQVSRRKLLRVCEFARSLEGGSSLDIGFLARQIADQQQALTQQGGKGRLLATMMLLVSESEIWRIDPNGQFWKCQAAFIGQNSDCVEDLMTSKLTSKGNSKIQERVNIWPTLFKKRALLASATNYRDLLSSNLMELSIEDAIILCARCLIETANQKDTKNKKYCTKNILLQAVVIKRPNQFCYFESSKIMKLLSST